MTSSGGPSGRPNETGPTVVSWRAVLPTYAVDTVAILPAFLAAGLAVQIREDIGLSLTGLGVAIGIFFTAAAIGSAAMGRLAERIGWARGLRLGALLATISLAAIAGWARSPASLMACFVVGGIANSVAHPAANLAVARCVTASRHGFFYGIRHASVPMATLLGGLAVPTVGLTVGWRWAFAGAAVLAAAALVSIPHDEANHTLTRPPPTEGSGQATPATPLRLLVILAIAVGLGIGGLDGVASFLVTYAVEIGIAEGTAGLLLAAGSVAGIITRLIAGWMIDRTRDADLTAVASMIAIGALGVAVLAFGGRPGLLIGGLIGFAAGWGWSGLFTFAIVKDNPGAPAAASGITQTGKLVGAAVGPAAVGILADGVSFAVAWWTTAATLAVAAGLILYVRSQRMPTADIR